jgi:hypothetical protein
MRLLVYNVRHSVELNNPPLLTITVYSSVITTLVYNDTNYLRGYDWVRLYLESLLATSATPQLKVAHVYWRYICWHSSCRGMRSSLFWVVMQLLSVIVIWRFWTAYQFHLQGLISSKRILLEMFGSCLITSAHNYQHTLCNKPEEQGPRLHSDGSLKSPLTEDFLLHPTTDEALHPTFLFHLFIQRLSALQWVSFSQI